MTKKEIVRYGKKRRITNKSITNMVTKESAMQIYNLYSQIEKSNEIIRVLRECKEQYEKDSRGVDIIRDGWGESKSIHLMIPERFINKEASSFSGCRIYQISVPDAILVLENHIVRLSKALEEEQLKAMKEDNG